MTATILEQCSGCGHCVSACPLRAISLETTLPNGFGKKRAVVNNNLCCDSGQCFSVCPHQAVQIDSGAR